LQEIKGERESSKIHARAANTLALQELLASGAHANNQHEEQAPVKDKRGMRTDRGHL